MIHDHYANKDSSVPADVESWCFGHILELKFGNLDSYTLQHKARWIAELLLKPHVELVFQEERGACGQITCLNWLPPFHVLIRHTFILSTFHTYLQIRLYTTSQNHAKL